MGIYERAQEQLERKNQEREQREQVLWLADQIHLASYHKRPKSEIDMLLERLRLAVERRNS